MDLDESMDLATARVIALEGSTPKYEREALAVLAARLDEIERRAQQIRGGLKPYARPVEIVDYLLAEPEG